MTVKKPPSESDVQTALEVIARNTERQQWLDELREALKDGPARVGWYRTRPVGVEFLRAISISHESDGMFFPSTEIHDIDRAGRSGDFFIGPLRSTPLDDILKRIRTVLTAAHSSTEETIKTLIPLVDAARDIVEPPSGALCVVGPDGSVRLPQAICESLGVAAGDGIRIVRHENGIHEILSTDDFMDVLLGDDMRVDESIPPYPRGGKIIRYASSLMFQVNGEEIPVTMNEPLSGGRSHLYRDVFAGSQDVTDHSMVRVHSDLVCEWCGETVAIPGDQSATYENGVVLFSSGDKTLIHLPCSGEIV